MSSLTIHVERVDDSVDGVAASDRLSRHVKSNIGVMAVIDVGDPGAVQRSEGKAQRVV